MKIFVANFDRETSEDDLESLFVKYGKANLVFHSVDWESGKSKGWGFVEMPDEDDAERAIQSLDGKWRNGKRLKVNKARPR